MMPLRLRMNTLPGAVMLPRIWLGLAPGSVTRLTATQPAALAPPALWSNASVVRAPTLKLRQFRIACAAVCLTVTVG